MTGHILVCGGAGYIGSHMCKRLAREGYVPVTFDNLSTGHRSAVKWGPFVEADLRDSEAIRRAFDMFRIDAVMHFAGCSQIAESMKRPGLYFRNNVTGTMNLLDAMLMADVGKLVFSSTAAVYGIPEYTPIDEAHPTQPVNPYGWSKLMAERTIAEYCRAHGLRTACLRYFNAAGADPDGEIGESHEPETHLIPNILKAALDPSRGPVPIFGDNYETPDGTCIRDYIHVADLCDAHLRALDHLGEHSGMHIFNLGTGIGFSVLEILSACRAACGGNPIATVLKRRPGDPPILVSRNSAALDLLKWRPRASLTDCVQDALNWHRSQ